MTTAPLGDARDHLSEYVADVQHTHDRVTITRYGQPAAMLISGNELASLDETVDILSVPGALEEIRHHTSGLGCRPGPDGGRRQSAPDTTAPVADQTVLSTRGAAVPDQDHRPAGHLRQGR